MEIISIQRPSNAKGKEWINCAIQEINLKPLKNEGSIVVYGIAQNNNANTRIAFNDLKSLIDGNEILSNHGYYKLKIPRDQPEFEKTIKLFQELTKIKF